MTQPYTRPPVTPEMEAEAARLVLKVKATHNLQTAYFMLTATLIENMRLVAECQEHRSARDLEPFPAQTAG